MEGTTRYVIGLLISVPFMNLNAATGGLIPFVGPIANALGGADISYFISFIVALMIYLLFTFSQGKKR